ncbi:Receptor-like serine/threonine-protein kinase ALE2, partial [Glycine soja]
LDLNQEEEALTDSSECRPWGSPASSQISTDPLIATPYGSPYGFVFPMKVRLVLDAAPLAVFPVIDDLEIELSSGTYLKQSQVRIMGVTADSQNQGRTTIDIHLVSHGKKFDNTTAVLLSKRFWHNEVPLNRSLFGDYYLGIPLSRPLETLTGRGHMPRESINVLPITADMNSENEKMNLRTIIVIALSFVVLLLVLVGAFYIILKWRKIRRPSSVVGPAFTNYKQEIWQSFGGPLPAPLSTFGN